MKAKYLVVSFILGLGLALSLLMTLGMTATAATPPTVADDVASANSRENGFDDLPPGLAPAIARALADELPASYHLQATEDGYRADNAAHDLATTFDAAGPHIKVSGETWGLALTGLGAGRR